MSKSKPFVYLLVTLLVAPVLSSCGKEVTIESLKKIEKNSIYHNYVKADLTYTREKDDNTTSSTYTYERYTDKNGDVWVIDKNELFATYYSNGYTCEYDEESQSIIRFDSYFPVTRPYTFVYDSLIEKFDSLKDSSKKITLKRGVYTLEFSAEVYLKTIYGSSFSILNNSKRMYIKAFTKNDLLTKVYFSYGIDISYIPGGGHDKYISTTIHRFTYKGSAEIPEKVQTAIDTASGKTDGLAVTVIPTVEDEYPMRLSSSITNDEDKYELNFYNLANYKYDIDNWNHILNPHYKLATDNKKYIVAIDNFNLYVYDIFTLKKLYTVILPLPVFSYTCQNGIMGLKLRNTSGCFFFNLDDFSEIKTWYSFKSLPLMGNGFFYFIEYVDNIGYLRAYSLETHEISDVFSDSYLHGNLYFNPVDDLLICCTSSTADNNHLYVFNQTTHELIGDVDFVNSSGSGSSYQWDGRYIKFGGTFSFDSRTLEVKYAYPPENPYPLLQDYENVSGRYINDTYDSVCFYDTYDQSYDNHWMYNKTNDSLDIHLPEMFGSYIIPVNNNYFISYCSEIIMTIRIK